MRKTTTGGRAISVSRRATARQLFESFGGIAILYEIAGNPPLMAVSAIGLQVAICPNRSSFKSFVAALS